MVVGTFCTVSSRRSAVTTTCSMPEDGAAESAAAAAPALPLKSAAIAQEILYLAFIKFFPKIRQRNTEARRAKRKPPTRAETVHADLAIATNVLRITTDRAFTVGAPREPSVKGKFQTDEC